MLEQADIEPGIFGLSVFQSMKETNAAWEGLVRLDFGGGESALEQFDPSDQPCVCFEIGTPSDKSFVCDSMPANADSPEDEAATWTEKSIGFPEWDELLDATVVPSDAMVMLEQSCWATYQYLKQPELRAKDTDRRQPKNDIVILVSKHVRSAMCLLHMFGQAQDTSVVG